MPRLLISLLLVTLAGAASLRAGTYWQPGRFYEPARFPDPARTVSVYWPSLDDATARKPPLMHALGQADGRFKTDFGPDRQGEKPIQYEADPGNPGKTKMQAAESQEGLSGTQAPQGLKNWETAIPVKSRVYTIPAPVDAALYEDGVNDIVSEFTPGPNAAKQLKVGYEWAVTNRATSPSDRLGLFEFESTRKDLLMADQLGELDGKKLSSPQVLGGSAWLPFQDADGAAQPAPFGGRPLKGTLSGNDDRIPPFSYTANTPGEYDVHFKLTIVRNNNTSAGAVEEAESGEVTKHVEIANLTPPMLMTGAAPGPVFATTGDPLDDEQGRRTPQFAQDDLYTVIWVMSNAHSGAQVSPDSADHVKSIQVNYPRFEQPEGKAIATMPAADHDLQVNPITGDISGSNIYNGGDSFGLASQGSNQSAAAGTPPLQGNSQPTVEVNRASMGVSDQFCPKMSEASSKAKSMQEFASGTFQDPKLTKEILAATPGKDGLVGSIQLPASFPMPECQLAMLSCFKVKVPIERAPVNFEGKVPLSVVAMTDSGPAGQMDGALSVIDNKPPDVTVAVTNPKSSSTRIVQVGNTAGSDRTLGTEPFAIRKAELSVSDSPVAPSGESQELSPTAPAPGTPVEPTQDQQPFPAADALRQKGIVKPDGSSDVVELPDNYASLKGAVIESLELPKDTFPADEDVRLQVALFPTDNVSTWDEMYVKIFSEESLSAGEADTAKPDFEGTMARFKSEQGGRFVSNARTTTENHQSRMRAELYDFDPKLVPYKGPSFNPKEQGKDTIRLFANCRRVIIPVARGGVSMELKQIQSERQRVDN